LCVDCVLGNQKVKVRDMPIEAMSLRQARFAQAVCRLRIERAGVKLDVNNLSSNLNKSDNLEELDTDKVQ
jgi:hypothetical protein